MTSPRPQTSPSSARPGGPGLPAVRSAAPGHDALTCHRLTARYRGRKSPTIREVSFALPTGGVLAVVGPSGSGKSTLCAAILGEIADTEGQALLSGVNLLHAPSLTRELVSFVPQRDALHSELTPRQALRLTAALRLGQSLTTAERSDRVEEVLARLELQDQAETAIGHLSGGQRKRVAVAMELLSEPRLLLLDEPTSGLDEGLDRVMMTLLHKVARQGCAVLVVTHSTANLGLADAVLALDHGGRVAYCGPPDGMLDTFGAANQAEIMQALRDGTATGLAHTRPTALPTSVRSRRAREEPTVGVPDTSGSLGVGHSTRILLERELRRLVASPFTLARGLLLLPLLTTVLTAWACEEGLAGTPLDPNRMQGAALSVLVTCTTFFAMALSFATIVGDRDVIERERRWGVPPVSVVASKAIAVLGPVLIQAAVALTGYLLLRPGPDTPLDGAPTWLMLWVVLGGLGVASMALGLLISAAAPRLERAVFLLMGTIAVLVVLTGLLIPLSDPNNLGGQVLSTLAQVAPTRWGTAALAAYLGYVPNEVLDVGQLTATDDLWQHDGHHLITALLSLVALAAAYLVTAAELLTVQSRRRR